MAEASTPAPVPLAGLAVASATLADALSFGLGVAAPTFAKGLIFRRPAVLHLLQRFGTEDKAVAMLGRLRQRYRADLLRLPVPARPEFLVLSTDAALAILAAAPEPFSPASTEKRSALAHFEPHTSLISRGPDRQIRRALSDVALESVAPLHSLAPHMAEIIGVELRNLLEGAEGGLAWLAFRDCWSRIVRRIVLGDHAADDRRLTKMLDTLRHRANWAFARRRDRRLQARFRAGLAAHLAQAEAGSLAAALAGRLDDPQAAPVDQVAQWLFAFDAAAIVIFRALAILVARPELHARARDEAAHPGVDKPFLRRCALETLRLWPTTPAILRETTRELALGQGALPSGSGVVIYTPFLHRAPEEVEGPADFVPDRWIAETTRHRFLPFSAGPAECPAHHLVPMLAGIALSACAGRLAGATGIEPARQATLPATFDHTRIRLEITGR